MKRIPKRLLSASICAAALVGASVWYEYARYAFNFSFDLASFVSLFVLLPALIVMGGIHEDHSSLSLFFVAWLIDTLILWGIFWLFRRRTPKEIGAGGLRIRP